MLHTRQIRTRYARLFLFSCHLGQKIPSCFHYLDFINSQKGRQNFYEHMKNQLQNYLKAYRKKSCLTQDEMAGLLGCESGSKISRYENSTRLPSLKTLMAYSVIFKASLSELFAGMYQTIKNQIEERILTLIEELKHTNPMDGKTTRKIEFLKRVLEEKK